jgi:Delta14-sterol reductase
MVVGELNPRTRHYEFLGPPGALFITIGVPFISYLLYFSCSERAGGCPPSIHLAWPSFTKALSSPAWWASLFELKPFLLYLAWYAFTVAAWALLPGASVDGPVLRDGTTKTYKINGTSDTASPCSMLIRM